MFDRDAPAWKISGESPQVFDVLKTLAPNVPYGWGGAFPVSIAAALANRAGPMADYCQREDRRQSYMCARCLDIRVPYPGGLCAACLGI